MLEPLFDVAPFVLMCTGESDNAVIMPAALGENADPVDQWTAIQRAAWKCRSRWRSPVGPARLELVKIRVVGQHHSRRDTFRGFFEPVDVAARLSLLRENASVPRLYTTESPGDFDHAQLHCYHDMRRDRVIHSVICGDPDIWGHENELACNEQDQWERLREISKLELISTWPMLLADPSLARGNDLLLEEWIYYSTQLLGAGKHFKVPDDQRQDDPQLQIRQPPPETATSPQAKRELRPSLLIKLGRSACGSRSLNKPPLRLELADIRVVPRPPLGALAALAARRLVDGKRRLQHAGAPAQTHHHRALGDAVAQELGVAEGLAVDHGRGAAAAEDLLHGGVEVRDLGPRDLLDSRAAVLGPGVREGGPEGVAQGCLRPGVVGQELDAPAHGGARRVVARDDNAKDLENYVSTAPACDGVARRDRSALTSSIIVSEKKSGSLPSFSASFLSRKTISSTAERTFDSSLPTSCNLFNALAISSRTHVKRRLDLLVALSLGEIQGSVAARAGLVTEPHDVVVAQSLDKLHRRADRAVGKAAAKHKRHDGIERAVVDIRLRREGPPVGDPRLVVPQLDEPQDARVDGRRGNLVQELRRHEVLQKPAVLLPLGARLHVDVVLAAGALEHVGHQGGPVEVLAPHEDVLGLSEVGQDHDGLAQRTDQDLEEGRLELGRLLEEPEGEFAGAVDALFEGRDVSQDVLGGRRIVGDSGDRFGKSPSVEDVEQEAYCGEDEGVRWRQNVGGNDLVVAQSPARQYCAQHLDRRWLYRV
ncbi:hypothetical protein ColLi_13612 [Colletotrichum liriopes]|uniref:Uncharacterized protein n=1 Tax=Colletotrichum liriopes TaxID=708192 RepID=A0AA37LZV8_9PEZI|nr:hypothetical protein ColLi_13612 [Colletotrichum liriopes]